MDTATSQSKSTAAEGAEKEAKKRTYLPEAIEACRKIHKLLCRPVTKGRWKEWKRVYGPIHSQVCMVCDDADGCYSCPLRNPRGVASYCESGPYGAAMRSFDAVLGEAREDSRGYAEHCPVINAVRVMYLRAFLARLASNGLDMTHFEEREEVVNGQSPNRQGAEGAEN